MAQETKQTNQKNLYFTSVPKNKISLELNVYNKATGQNEKVFINGSTRGVAALIKNIVNSDYKSTSIKDIKLKNLENGAKVVESFEFGTKGDIRNLNVEVNRIKFKWHTIDKETGKKSKEYTTEIFLYSRRDENKKVHWGKTPEAEKAIIKQMNEFVKALENKSINKVRIGINFVEGKDGKTKAFIDYIGTPRMPEKEKQNIEEKKEKETQKPKPADAEIPF